MNQQFDVIVFGPHPDDAEFSMGGTLIKLARAGHKILSVCLTHGEMGTHGSVELRDKEFENACKATGITGMFLDFKDTGVENTREGRLKLARIIRETRPKIVFAPYHTNPTADFGGVSNVDHYATGALVRDAVKMARLQKTVPDVPKHTIERLILYMLPRHVVPTLYVDVSDVIDEYSKLVEHYTTQMSINFLGNDIHHILKTRRAALGIDLGVKYAESFTTDVPLNLKVAPSSLDGGKIFTLE